MDISTTIPKGTDSSYLKTLYISVDKMLDVIHLDRKKAPFYRQKRSSEARNFLKKWRLEPNLIILSRLTIKSFKIIPSNLLTTVFCVSRW